MAVTHLLRVEEPATALEPLVAAARSAGMRVGWLELDAAGGTEAPAALEAAAGVGVLRAVAVGSGRSIAVKAIVGEPVLRDLLREHFLGCRLVLVKGSVDCPQLAAEPGGWRLRDATGRSVVWSTEEVLAALQRPRLLPPD